MTVAFDCLMAVIFLGISGWVFASFVRGIMKPRQRLPSLVNLGYAIIIADLGMIFCSTAIRRIGHIGLDYSNTEQRLFLGIMITGWILVAAVSTIISRRDSTPIVKLPNSFEKGNGR